MLSGFWSHQTNYPSTVPAKILQQSKTKGLTWHQRQHKIRTCAWMVTSYTSSSRSNSTSTPLYTRSTLSCWALHIPWFQAKAPRLVRTSEVHQTWGPPGAWHNMRGDKPTTRRGNLLPARHHQLLGRSGLHFYFRTHFPGIGRAFWTTLVTPFDFLSSADCSCSDLLICIF